MDVQGFRNAVETLKLYHRINNSDFSVGTSRQKNNLIDELYVDLLPNNGIYSQAMSHNTTFIIGRRGTGKSTVFAYAQNQIHKEKEHLSVYLNAKSVHELSKVENIGTDLSNLNGSISSVDIRRLLLIRIFLKVFKSSLLEELKNEDNGFFETVPNYFRDKRLRKELEKLDVLLKILNLSI